ncbi:hypothetical protein ABC345_21370 [Shouchella sp. 1P09AA]|uniref:hypothetical protein n=1 Tax=unclassified Shouchella TaxID=2893065 RepID=UPI00399EF361
MGENAKKHSFKALFTLLMVAVFTIGSVFGTSAFASASEPTEEEVQEYAQEFEGEIQPYGPISTAVGFLTGLGLGWLAENLLDQGTDVFCDNYYDSNAAAAWACDWILGYDG